MYKSRVIPAVHQENKKKPAHEIALAKKTTKLNMYSTLDKTIVLWQPWRKGTRIYILRASSPSSAVEWYTFFHSALGWKRPSSLTVNVPDFEVRIELDDPYSRPEEPSNDELPAIASDKVAAGDIIQRCVALLTDSPMTDATQDWVQRERMGLAWKRYDRLEWIYGANEQKMYGTLAMEQSHDLELRPKQHYPTNVPTGDGEKETMEEPAPIEGFLVRLTSQKGRESRYGRMYSKRLYFSTHNQYFCFCKPGKAVPPAYPGLSKADGSGIPSAQVIAEKIPLIYAVNPFPIDHGQVTWLKGNQPAERVEKDLRACQEAERTVNNILDSTGYIDLSQVIAIRHMNKDTSPPAAQDLEEISEGRIIDIEAENENSQRNPDDGRTFELVLKNGLRIRLQAFNKITKQEWMTRLANNVIYWKLRIAEDMNVYKLIRRTNLETLNIDEEMEAHLGQSGEKWEVTQSVASPELFNMCGISCCRTITVSLVLARSPRAMY
jgi:hypothetical protein